MNDLVFFYFGEFFVVEFDRFFGCFGVVIDQIQYCGFIGFVGVDNDVDFIFIDIKREVVYGFEVIE